jgi:hypothetical protein
LTPRQEAVLIVLLALSYFVSVYFAAAALFPDLAYQIALVAVILAMGAYWFLDQTGSTQDGLPMGILLFAPVICLAAGAVWWVLRSLGLLELR